jgi:hypothetical protein
MAASPGGVEGVRAVQPDAPRPHIVCIVSDDQGWKYVGFHGSDIATPNLDGLARGGARLEQFYAQPMCTPSGVELFDPARDLEEATDLSGIHPGKVVELQARVQRLADEVVAPLIFEEALGVVKPALFGSVAFPPEVAEVSRQP